MVAAENNTSSDDCKPWQCATCTFENLKADKLCGACMSMRPDPPEQPVRLTQEELAEKHWNYIVRYCRLKKTCYVDKTFSPCASSLYYSPEDNKDAPYVRWERVRNVVSDDSDSSLMWVVFRKPLPSDISQGKWR